MNFQYWLIRYVPDVARGEFTNVGILCGAEDGDWAVKFDNRVFSRRATNPPGLREIAPWAEWLTSEIVVGGELDRGRLTSGWVNHLRTRQSNAVQFSEPQPVMVESAVDGVELLYPLLVERAAPRRNSLITRQSMRDEVKSELRSAYRLTEGKNLFVQPRATLGKQRTTFDLLRNDTHAQGLFNVWTFNYRDLERLQQHVQASNFFISVLRNATSHELGEATLRTREGQPIKLDFTTPITVVFDPPRTDDADDQRQDIFAAAVEAWRVHDVDAMPLEEFRHVAKNHAHPAR